MSPIGRVFIVLNLLLAAVFLGYAGFYLQNHDTYRQKYLDEVAAHRKSNEANEGKISQLESEKQSVTDDLQTSQNDLRNERQQRKSAEETIETQKASLNDLQGRIANIEANTSKLSTTIDNQNTRIQEMTNQWLAAKEAKDKALAARDDALDKQAVAERNLANADRKNGDLTAELAEKVKANERMSTELSVILAEIPDARAIAARALPAVTGTVEAVNSDLKSVTVALGKSSGVKTGWSFAVHDGKNYKGQIRITEVAENRAFGRIESTVPGYTMRKGDKAETQLKK